MVSGHFYCWFAGSFNNWAHISLLVGSSLSMYSNTWGWQLQYQHTIVPYDNRKSTLNEHSSSHMALTIFNLSFCALPDTSINDFYTDFTRLTSKAELTRWENIHTEAGVIVEFSQPFRLDYLPVIVNVGILLLFNIVLY